jgi:hypothetical protein
MWKTGKAGQKLKQMRRRKKTRNTFRLGANLFLKRNAPPPFSQGFRLPASQAHRDDQPMLTSHAHCHRTLPWDDWGLKRMKEKAGQMLKGTRWQEIKEKKQSCLIMKLGYLPWTLC